MIEIHEPSSIPVPGPIESLLAESFELLHRRLPPAYARMLALLQASEVELVLDAERIHLRFRPGAADSSFRPGTVELSSSASIEPEPGCPRIECTLAAIVAVLDGQLTLAAAVESDAVRVRADLDRLVHLHDGLLAYVHGAVRCPGFPELLLRLRALAQPTP